MVDHNAEPSCRLYEETVGYLGCAAGGAVPRLEHGPRQLRLGLCDERRDPARRRRLVQPEAAPARADVHARPRARRQWRPRPLAGGLLDAPLHAADPDQLAALADWPRSGTTSSCIPS